MNKSIYHIQEGEPVPYNIISKFNLTSFDLRGKNKTIADFTGIVLSSNNILISWPKHYFTKEELSSHELVKNPKYFFSLILKHIKSIEESNINDGQGDYDDVYPLKEFLDVLQYYQNYGLYHQEEINVVEGYEGKIDWKRTISKSNQIVSNGNLLYAPFKIRRKGKKAVFLSECMAYIINETFDLLSFALPQQISKVNYGYNKKKFLNNEYILRRLNSLQNTVFKDTEKLLLRSIIKFFQNESNKKETNYKTKNFQSIWEVIIEQHLNKNLLEISEDEFKLRKNCMNYNFGKKSFDVGSRSIEVDHYYEDEEYIYILDSKYYDYINDLNYKQVSYDYFLRKEGKRNINILVLPSTKNHVKEHFRYDEDGVLIIEYHFSIKDIIEEYL